MADSVKLPKPRFGQIVVLQKNGDEPRGHGFPLIGRDCVIGRSEDADIRISSADVSLIHCKIVVEEETGECSLEVHGRETELNGNIIDPVATVKLLHRDVVLIGGRRLRFEYLPPDYKPMPSKNFAKKHQQIALEEKEEEEKEGHLRAEVVDNDEVADEDEQKQQQDCAGSNSSKSEDESTDCGDVGSVASVVPDLMTFTPSTTTVSKRVSFGPYLSPEQFDNTLPPATPVKRGATPRTSRRYSGLKFTRSSSIAPLVEEVAAEATAEQGGEDQQQFNKEEEIKENIAPPPLDESTMQSADGTDAMSTMSDVSNTAVVPSECTSFLDDDITTDVDPSSESQQQDEDEDYGGSGCIINNTSSSNNATKGDNDSTVDQVLASDSDQDEEFYEPSVVADGDESVTCQQDELPFSQTATNSISIDNQDDEEKENKLNDVSSSAAPLPIDEQGALEKKDPTEDDDEEIFQSPTRSIGSLSPVKAPIGGGSNIGDETRLLLSPPGTSSLGAIADSTALELQLLQTPKAVAGASSMKEGRKSVRSAAVVAAAKISNTPKADYVTNVTGIKKLMQTPKVVPETPKADYTDVRGVKRLLKTPSAAAPETPKADYVTNVDEGMKKLLQTPKSQPPSTPKADYTNVEGVKKLMQTPKPGQAETPKADYRDVSGMKRLLRTPKVATTTVAHATPKADYVSNVDIGMKKLLATPKPLPQTPKGDYVTNVEGIERLMKTPLVMKDNSSDISGEELLAKTATGEGDEKQVTGVPEGSQQPTLASMDLDGGEMCSGKENGKDDSKSPVIDSDCHTPAEGEIDSVAAVPATAESTPSTNVASGLPVVISPQSETDTACIQPEPSDNEPFLVDKAGDDVEETLIPSIAADRPNKIDEENDGSTCSSTDPHSAASPPLAPLSATTDADESSAAKVQLVHQADDPSIVDVVKTPALTRRGRAASASNAATPCLPHVAVTELTTPSNKRGRRRDRSASTEEEEAESQLPPTAAVTATPVQHRHTKTSGGRIATPTVASNASGSVNSASKASRSTKRSRLMQQPTLPSVADDDGNTSDDVTAAEASALKEEASQQQLETPNSKTLSAIGGEGVLIADQIAKEPMEEAAAATVISDDSGAQSPTATSEQQPTIALNNDEEIPAVATPAVSSRRCTPRRPLAESMTIASAAPSTPSTLPILEAADETEEEVEVKKLSSSGIPTESSANGGESKNESLDVNSPASASQTVDDKSDKEDGGGELEALTTSTETETEDGSTGTYNNEPNPVPSTPKSSSSRSAAVLVKKTLSSSRKGRQTTTTPRSSGRSSSRTAASSSKRTASTMDEATEVEEELPIMVSDLKEQGEMEIDNSACSVGISKMTTANKRRRETAETASAATPTAPSTPLRASSRAATVAAAKSRAQAQHQSPVPASSSRTRRGAVVSKQQVTSASVPSSDEDNNEKKMEEEEDSETPTRTTRTTGRGQQSKAPSAASKSKAKPKTTSTSKKQKQQGTPVDYVADSVAEGDETEEVIEPPTALAPSAGRAKRSSKKEKAQVEEPLTTDASQPPVQPQPVVHLTRCVVPTSSSADSSPPPSSKRSSKRTAAEQQPPVQKAVEVKTSRGRRRAAAASTAELMSDDSISSVVSSSSTMTPTTSSEVDPSAGSRKRSNKETKVTTTEVVKSSPSEQQQSAKRTRRTATATAPSQKEEEPMEVVVEEDELPLPATPLADKKKKQKVMKSTTPSRSSQKKATKSKNVHFASDFDNDDEQDQVSPSPPLRKTRGGRGAAAATTGTAKGKGKSTAAGDKKTIVEVEENDNSNQEQEEDDVDEDALPPQRQTRQRGAVTKSSGGVEENKTKGKGKSSKATSKQPLKKGRAASAPSSSDEDEDLKQLQQEKKETTAGNSESEDDKVEMEEELTSPPPAANNSKTKAKSTKVTTAGSNSKSKSKTKSTTGTKSAVASPPSPQVVAPPSPRRTRRTRNN